MEENVQRERVRDKVYDLGRKGESENCLWRRGMREERTTVSLERESNGC